MGTLNTKQAEPPPSPATPELITAPAIARSNPYNDLRPFIEHLWVTDAAKYRSVFTDLFPRGQHGHASKEEEDAFIEKYFAQDIVREQGPRFLKQALYSIALYNEDRVRKFAAKWSKDNRDLLDDKDSVNQICSPSASIRVVFSTEDCGEHDDAFLTRAIAAIRHGLSHKGKVHDDSALPPAKDISIAGEASAEPLISGAKLSPGSDDECAVVSASPPSPSVPAAGRLHRAEEIVAADVEHHPLKLSRVSSAPQAQKSQVAERPSNINAPELSIRNKSSDGRANNYRRDSSQTLPAPRPGLQLQESRGQPAPYDRGPPGIHVAPSRHYAVGGSFGHAQHPSSHIVAPQYMMQQTAPPFVGHHAQLQDGTPPMLAAWPAHPMPGTISEGQTYGPSDARMYQDQIGYNYRGRGGRGGQRGRGPGRTRGNLYGHPNNYSGNANYFSGYNSGDHFVDPESFQRHPVEHVRRGSEGSGSRRSVTNSYERSDNWCENQNLSPHQQDRRVFSDQPPANMSYYNAVPVQQDSYQGHGYKPYARHASNNDKFRNRSSSIHSSERHWKSSPGEARPDPQWGVGPRFIGASRTDILELNVLNLSSETTAERLGVVISSFLPSQRCEVKIVSRPRHTGVHFDSTREARIVLDKGQGILIDGSVIYFEVPVQLRPVAFPDDGHSRGNYHRPPFQGHGGLGSRPLPGIPTAYHPTNVPHDNSYSDWSADGRSSRSSSAVPHFDQRQNTGRVPVYAADASDVPRLYQPHASGMGPPDYRQAGDRTFARASSRQRDYQRQASKNSQRPGSEHSTPRKKHNKIGKNKNNWQQERDRVESDWNTASVSLPNNPRADSRLGEHDNDTGPVVSDPVNAWQDKTVKEQVNEGATQLELLPVSTSLPSSEGFQTLEDQGAVPYPASEIDNEQACEASSPTISTALPVPDQSSGTGQTTAGTKTAEVGLAEDVSTTSLEEISKMPADVRKSPTVAAAKVDTEIDTSLVTTPEKQEVQLDTNVVSEIPLKRVATPGGASAHPIARKSSRSFTPRRRDFSSPKNGDDVDDSFQTAVETPESTRSVSMPVTPSLAAGVKPAIRVESSESDNAPVSGLSELPAPMQAGTQLTSSILTPSVSDDGTDTTVFNSPASTITGKSPTVAEPHIKKTTILTGPKQTESLSPFGRPVQSKKRDKKKKQAKNKEKSKSDTKSQDSVPEGSSKLHTGETDPPGLGIKAANQPLPGIPQSDGPAGTLALHSHQYKESKPQSTTLSKKRQPPTESKSSGGLVGAVTANFPWVFGSKHHDQIRSTKDDDASKLERSKPAAELPKTDKSGKCQALDVDLHADLGPTPIQTPLSQQNDVGTTIESGPFPEQHIHKSGKPNDDTNTSTTRPGSEASAPGSPKSEKTKSQTQ